MSVLILRKCWFGLRLTCSTNRGFTTLLLLDAICKLNFRRTTSCKDPNYILFGLCQYVPNTSIRNVMGLL